MSKVHGCVRRSVRPVEGTTLAVLCLSVVIVSSLLMLGCVSSAPATRSDPFIGTWVNDKAYGPWEYTHTADGKMFVYSKADPKHPYMEARYQIVKKWRDAKGDYLYNVRSLWSAVPYDKQSASTWYATILIDPSGNKAEEWANETGYVDPSPTNALWGTFHRVK